VLASSTFVLIQITKDKSGATPLHYAAANRNTDIVKMLIEHNEGRVSQLHTHKHIMD
jgi:ankyrin repeat protein